MNLVLIFLIVILLFGGVFYYGPHVWGGAASGATVNWAPGGIGGIILLLILLRLLGII